MQDRVQRNLSRAEDEDNQPRHQKDERRGRGELVRRGEERHQRLAIGRDVGNHHVTDAQQRQRPRSQAQRQQNSADEFQQCDEPRVGGRQGIPRLLKY